MTQTPASFKVALTADFYDAHGATKYRDIGLTLFDACNRIMVSQFAEHRSEIEPQQLAGVNGVIVLTPRVTAQSLTKSDELLAIGRFGVGFDGVDVVAEFKLLIALEEARLEGLVALQELEHGIVGVNHAGIRDGAEQFVIGGHRVSVAVIPLVRAGGGVARDDAAAVGRVVAGQRQFNVAEGRGKEFGQFEIDRGAFNAAERVAIGFEGAHNGRVGVVAVLAHHAGQALKNAHVSLVLFQSSQVNRQFMPVEGDFHWLLLCI